MLHFLEKKQQQIFLDQLKDSTQIKHNCVKTLDVRHNGKQYRVSQVITSPLKCSFQHNFLF